MCVLVVWQSLCLRLCLWWWLARQTSIYPLKWKVYFCWDIPVSTDRQTDKVSVFALPFYLFAAWLLASSSSHKYPRLESRAHICPPCIWLHWQHLDTLLAITGWACSTLITWLHHLTCPVQDIGELKKWQFFLLLFSDHWTCIPSSWSKCTHRQQCLSVTRWCWLLSFILQRRMV